MARRSRLGKVAPRREHARDSPERRNPQGANAPEDATGGATAGRRPTQNYGPDIVTRQTLLCCFPFCFVVVVVLVVVFFIDTCCNYSRGGGRPDDKRATPRDTARKGTRRAMRQKRRACKGWRWGGFWVALGWFFLGWRLGGFGWRWGGFVYCCVNG